MFWKKEFEYGEALIKCPKCKVKMKKLKKQDIIIDVCKKCKGMWIDAGEMEKLANIWKGEKNGKE